MLNFIMEYRYMEQTDFSPNKGEDCLMVLQGHRGFKSTICHYTVCSKYRIYPSIVIAELSEEQDRINRGCLNNIKDSKPKPFYTLDGYIDLNKFKMIPISQYEKNDLIKPDRKYIINRGGTKYDIAISDDGYFSNKDIKSFLPHISWKNAQSIFRKIKEKEQRLKIMEKDFV